MRRKPAPKLTRRETQVMRIVGDGGMNKTAADVLGIHPKTVDSHKRSAYKKLGINNVAHAAHWALAAKVIKNRF